MENMIGVPITKRMEIITSIQDCLISQMNFDYKENDGKKTFLANPKHQYRVCQREEQDCSAHIKKNRDYYKYTSLSYSINDLLL